MAIVENCEASEVVNNINPKKSAYNNDPTGSIFLLAPGKTGRGY